MGELLTTALLWVTALGCGVIGGVYFAFLAFVMAALRTLPADAGMAAMRAVNRVILRSPFMPLFFGTSAAALLLGVMAISAAASWPAVFGAAVHLVGMTGVTVAFNVPLNTRIERAGENTVEAEAAWQHYLMAWTRWNHLRTISSILAAALFTLALIHRE
jgi:uncharacterized membrane protein